VDLVGEVGEVLALRGGLDEFDVAGPTECSRIAAEVRKSFGSLTAISFLYFILKDLPLA
jgi:hypothetical protein